MDPEQLLEWQSLEDAALESVRASVTLRADEARVLQFITMPAFKSATAWEVARSRRHPENCRAIRTRWNREADFDKLRSPVERLKHPRKLRPTIEHLEIAIDSSDVNELLARIELLRIAPYVKEYVVGTDGVSYELSIGDDGFLAASYHWWVEPPEPWKPLASLVENFVARLEARLETP